MQAAKARTALGTALVKRIAAPARVAVGLLGLVGIAASGCGDDGDGGGGGGDTSRFVGSWRYTVGQVVSGSGCTLPGGRMVSIPLAGAMLDVAPGAASALSAVRAGCALKLDVNGSEATAQKGQSCSAVAMFEGLEVPVTVTLASWKLRTTDGQNAMVEGTGTAEATILGSKVQCNVTETGTLVRGAGDAGAR